MPRPRQPIEILVTGASRGIGRATAKALAHHGHRVTAVARSREHLDELSRAFPTVTPLVMDLIRRVPSGTYDCVVLNAATYSAGRLLDPATDVFSRMWELNVLANHRIARSLLPPMIARGRGHLIVIGSTATDAAADHMTAYAATKRALRALYDSWVQELGGTAIRTTLIAPGATLTSSWEKEIPPPHIQPATAVAALVLRVVTEGLTGRIVIREGRVDYL